MNVIVVDLYIILMPAGVSEAAILCFLRQMALSRAEELITT